MKINTTIPTLVFVKQRPISTEQWATTLFGIRYVIESPKRAAGLYNCFLVYGEVGHDKFIGSAASEDGAKKICQENFEDEILTHLCVINQS